MVSPIATGSDATSSGKSIQAQAYILGSLGGVDIRLFADYSQDFDGRQARYVGELAQESAIGLLGLASKLGGFTLPTGIPDLLLSDLRIELETDSTVGVKAFSFTGRSTLALGKKFDLLGLTVEPPEGVVFTFALTRTVRLVGQTRQTAGQFALTLSMPKQSQLKLSSAMAWTREIPGLETLRELQNDENLQTGSGESSPSSELVGLILAPKATPSADITEENAADLIEIRLVEKTLGSAGAARYLIGFETNDWALTFQFLGTSFPLSGETAAGAENSASTTPLASGENEPEFTFPFLKSEGAADLKPAERPAQVAPTTPSARTANATQTANSANKSKASKLGQAISVGRPSLSDVSLTPTEAGETAIKIAFPAKIKVGSLEFSTKLPVSFALGSFAIAVHHPSGIEIRSPEAQLKPTDKDGKPQDRPFDLFGLEWQFFGAPTDEGDYHHFTLVTQDFNYQIQQAPGARIEVAYTKASRDPIVFLVEDFAVSAKGISITATVSDRPARLNGIDTQYRFHGSQLRIVENEILDFTLSGSGPLPPKLVGDAMADISLQFRQEDGNLKLVAGAAKIQGNKILDCKGTRFRFSIDSMGLQFVNDERFHLFFTLTGSARFTLQKGDDRKNGALSMLPNIQIDLIDCPLTGDASVIAKHIQFLIELPKPISFPFLGAYEFELRAIGFLPQFEPFGNDVAMQISGQLKFAQGKGDVASDKPDLHSLFIGLPEPGGFLPRLYMDKLPLDINAGEAFKLNGVVEFKDDELIKGFEGEGVLEIQGMPPIAASFGFYRVRGSEAQPWVRAWFIYIEIRQVSFRVPVVEFYIREVGLGFGYRYTLVGIKRADEAKSLTQLLQELKVLSRTQGDLSRRDRWALDLEEPGQDPRWTIVLRAMIAQLSAAPSPLTWNAAREENLACVYLFDAVIAFRSDLTFFMNVRGWINTSYGVFVKERNDGNELEPLFTGFVFLWPRRKRFLAHLASNPNGHLGSKPTLPEFTQDAIRSIQFSATLLIEPGLMHFELGWPNVLRWTRNIGPLKAEMRGGFIFRITSREMVIGISFLARASLAISASVSLGLVGASVEANANAAFGARFIGLVDFETNRPTLYGAIGLELRIRLSVSLWIKIPLLFKTIKLSYRFTLNINFTAGLEFAINGLNDAGLRGSGTLSISAMGHRLQFNVRLSSNAAAVNQARQRTEKYLNLGLEATEVDTTLPGVDAGSAGQRSIAAQPAVAVSPAGMVSPEASAAPASPAMAAFAVQAPVTLADRTEAIPVSERVFSAPDYSVFVIRDAHDEYAYFVLFPRSTRDEDEANRKPGFLPVPPTAESATAEDGAMADFRLVFPEGVPSDLEWFNPIEDLFQSVPVSQNKLEQNELRWQADWDQSIFDNAESFEDGNTTAEREQITLRDYLLHAYLTEVRDEAIVPIADPQPLTMAEADIVDERVQNPSDNAFEAAVRGATEQFRGSPFFKRDPNCAYEQTLEQAFKQETTIYEGDSPDNEQVLDANQQAHQVRSMVINDLIGDLRKYVDGPEAGDRNRLTRQSVAFQMGLVFRVPKGNRPAWLDRNLDADQTPQLYQRSTRNAPQPDSESLSLRTFNTLSTDFAKNPPQFQQVQHYTDANTIAIAWDLTQTPLPQPPGELPLTALQQDPEHSLMYYEVRRRSLSAQTPEVTYQVKGASVLHRSQDDRTQGNNAQPVLNILRPRFQVVDHFTEESLDDIIRLPATGLSYLYTITPYDFAGNAGHPLTLVATRYPNEPPPVPVESKLTVHYQLSDDLALTSGDRPTLPLMTPQSCTVTWTEPSTTGPQVPVQDYYLIFRKETTLPIGSYGLDSSTQRPRTQLLPTSNSRALPTDIRLKLAPTGLRRARSATVSVEALRQAGILPDHWQPEAWTLFIQTVSVNQVPSALAPVQVQLEFTSESGAQVEERRPAELEWLPKPLSLSLLPPEDQRATVGMAHVPMPRAKQVGEQIDPTQFEFIGSLAPLRYQAHPAGLRCIRFRWNQGPSQARSYPLALTASYDLLELDIDAHTTATFNDAERLAEALRSRQTVQMLSAADLLLTPGDTLVPNQWEAWYPSQIARRLLYRPIPGAQISESPWYSWRDSILDWPEWTGLTDGDGLRETALHPFLENLVSALQDRVDGNGENLYIVSLQTSPPLQPQTLATFLQSTAVTADPYGWGVLQRFGLSTTFTLQDARTGDYIAGNDLLQIIQTELNNLITDSQLNTPPSSPSPPSPSAPPAPKISSTNLTPHLHVELLFQAGQSISLTPNAAVPVEGMLALIQISLRPTIRQVQRYYRIAISGDNNAQIKLRFNLAAPLSLIDQADPGSGQVDLDPVEGSQVERTITVPLNGQVNLLLRTPEPPTVDQILEAGESPIALLDLPISDSLTAYFTANPKQLAAEFQIPDANTLLTQLTPQQRNWWRFKRYAEALNGTAESDVKIEVPTEAKAIATNLSEVMLWSLRFFNAAAVPTVNNNLGTTTGGPWLATAYPKADTPAPATPDASGRLTYDHLIADKWAHTYRYYIRPNHRYGLLWESLLTSPVLFPQQSEPGLKTIHAQSAATPDPEQGGLDVVLDRVQPVAMPVILSSARLDPPAQPGQPVPPGRTWEVIIAQHPEQTLMERNQTLARQLQFRQVAFTLLRRFAYTETTGDDWETRINALLQTQGSTEHQLQLLINEDGHLPDGLPGEVTTPDHIDFKRIPTTDTDFANLSAEEILQIEADARSLDLPTRLGNFQQGALVLQWDTLPFFYQHQLLLVAQSDHQVSEINRVIHKDFEYRSPRPTATLEGQSPTKIETLPEPFGKLGTPTTEAELPSRRVSIPLKQLWDSLPETVRQQWPSEAPTLDWEDSLHRRSPGALPDLEVVYQLIQILEGNLEVQVEAYVDQPEDGPEQYQLRQLGKYFFGRFDSIDPPTPAQSVTQSNYRLHLTLWQVSAVSLLQIYNFAPVDIATRSRLAFDQTTQQLRLLGVLTATDRSNMQQVMAQTVAELRLLRAAGLVTTHRELLEIGYASRLVRSDAISLTDTPVPLPDIPGLSYITVPTTLILQDRQADAQQVSALANRCDAKLKATLLGESGAFIIADEVNNFSVAAAPLLTNIDLSGIPVNKAQPDPQTSELTWLGSLSSTQADTLRRLLFDPAVDRLRSHLQTLQLTQPYTSPPPAPPAPPASLSAFTLSVNDDNTTWALRWTGELTSAAMTQIHALVGDSKYKASAISLFRQVLAGQKAYVQKLRDEETVLNGQIQQQQQDIDRLTERNNEIAQALGQTAPLDQIRLQTERAANQAQISVLSAALSAAQASANAAKVAADSADITLNSALAQFEALTSAAERNAIATTPTPGNFLTTAYSQTIVWAVSVALLQTRLSAVGQSQSANSLSRLKIELTALVWQNLDNVDVRELQTQVRRVLDPDRVSPVVQSFLNAFDALIDTLEAQSFTFDYRPFPAELDDALRARLMVRGRLLRTARALNETEQTRLLNRFSDPLTQASLRRLFTDVQDKTTLDRLYERWLAQVYVPTSVDLTGLSEPLLSKLETVSFPAADEYALIWQGSLSSRDRAAIRDWRQGLTDPDQLDAVDALLRQAPRDSETTPPERDLTETVILARGTPPALTTSALDAVRERLRLGDGTLLRYHGLMTVEEAEALRPKLNHEAALQQLFEASLTQSLQGGDLRIMARRGSAKPSDLVPLQPRPLS